MKTYETLLFPHEPNWSAVPVGKIDCFNWEQGDSPYRPESSFKLCLVRDIGIFLKMKTNEKNLRTVCKGRDENCWEDSCMEFFFKPFPERDEYINFEMTPNGAFLSAFGKNRDNRVFLKALTPEAPSVQARITDDGWELELIIKNRLISDVYKTEFVPTQGEYYGNFYKCADKTATAHYGSFSPMGSFSQGFHAPELFAKIIVKDVYTYVNK